ncbi:MAG TPA: glycosyltransferase family 4 protein [Pyrinomonadaceae bacterium]|nr:glycosyltransferase family 4 protein [Pyrinomonadaceae bacterium]
MKSLTVLITNARLGWRAGTELYVRDLARGLLARGHTPVVYSPRPGPLAEEVRQYGVPVLEDLGRLSAPPDLIHGHHADETVTALLRFPSTPALFVCHDWFSTLDYPPAFPRVLRYVAVDQPCHDKLVFEHGLPAGRVRVLYEFVDLERFKPRGPLPPRPRRALVLCNYTKENEHLRAAREACRRAGLTLDVYGIGVGRTCAEPEKLLREYDLVFAKGRAALEALAVGAAVVVYWWRRLGPLVSAAELERLRRDNFGVRALGERLTPEEFGRAVAGAVARYDAADAAEVCASVRASAGSDRAVEELLALYEEVLAEHAAAPPPDPEAEARAASEYLRRVTLGFEAERRRIYDSTPYRLTERVLRAPLLGRAARLVARAAAGRKKN